MVFQERKFNTLSFCDSSHKNITFSLSRVCYIILIFQMGLILIWSVLVHSECKETCTNLIWDKVNVQNRLFNILEEYKFVILVQSQN